MSEQYDFVRKLREKQTVPENSAMEEALLYQEVSGHAPVQEPPALTAVPNFCDQCGQSLTARDHGERRRHSRLGMAATAKAFLLGLVLLGSIVIALMLPESTEDLWYSLIALVWIGVFSAAVLGMGLSLPGLFHQKRHKLFPVMGMVFNACIVGFIILLMLFCVACYVLYPEAGADENDYDFVRRSVVSSVETV